jgi:O-antigen/teichoic acid export membrane protein
MILDKAKSDFLIILVGKILQVILMIVAIRVSTALLEPKEMGNIYIFTTIYTFFVLLLISPFGQYINRHTHQWHEQKSLLDNLGLYSLYLIIISIFSVIVGFLLYSFGVSQEIELEYFLSLLFLFILFMTLNQTILPLLNMLHYRFSFTILTVLTAFGIIFFGYLFVNFFGNNAENWLLGMVVSNMIFMIMGFFILKNRLNEEFNGFFYSFKKITKEKIKSILVFVMPLSIATLFMWLQNSGYRILIEQNIGLEFLGFLGVGLAISGQVASTIESIVMQYFHPIYYKQITNATIQERKKAIESFINKALPIYFMLAIFLTFLAKYVVEILVDEKYYGVYIFTTFGIWIEFFRMSSNLFGNISQSEMNTKKFMTPYIIGSLVTIILVYFSSSKVDYEFYLPIALLIGGLFTMIVMYISMKKLIDFKIDFRLIFFSFLVSLPYFSTYLFNFETNLVLNLLVVGSFGIYFLGTIYFIYKKGLSYGNS